ncbi:MAG: chemotaxis protein CheW, partial [Vicinamibacterales bacterium]|nr:chemotaxis protein CheW [Vicinamibacterales bacterium]
MADELLTEFINESREHLATIEADLLTIEEGGAEIDEDLVNKVFRAAHSIKGAAGFLGLHKVKELSHRAETLLDMMRSRTMAPNPEITNVLLMAFDCLRDMINNAEHSEDVDIAELVESLTAMASSYLPQAKKASLTASVTLAPAPAGPAIVLPELDFERARRSKRFVYAVDYDLIHDIERKGRNVLQVFRDIEATGEILDCSLNLEAAGTLDGPVGNQLPLRLVFSTVLEPAFLETVFDVTPQQVTLLYDPRSPVAPEVAPAPADDPPPALAAPQPPAADEPADASPAAASPARKPAAVPPATSGSPAAEDTLRVNVGVLESLMNLVGELVLSRNQLRSAIGQNDPRALAAADQRLNLVTSELQDTVMRTRLQPIGNVFAKLPRIVRDTASTLGKEIELDVRGKDVALDRSMIEGLSDPLTHMVRNAMDHGIERPADRTQAGKRPAGTIRVEARHEAGQVVVEIADDGKGIDPARVASSAVSKGLLTAERVQGMSDAEKIGLIFLPGLSTSQQVSDISGRGVGMDVVKTNLDRLGGTVDITSIAGSGTTFRIKLPLTLAIMPALITSVGTERFAIPQINVEELLRIRPEEVKRRIEVVGGAEVLLLRDRIIPLVRFDDLLGTTPSYVDPSTGETELERRANLADRRSPRHGHPAAATGVPAAPHPRQADGRRTHPSGALEIAVVTTGTQQYGLVVGGFHSTEEIVVKPLGRHLNGLREYAGATILGDGAVALILDVGGVAAKADLASVSGTARAAERAAEAERERLEDTKALLLFHNHPHELCATPLDTVVRLERITASQIETAGGRRTMQYRGASLPLVMLADAARLAPVPEDADLAVIVSRVAGREVGLLGAMPLDVVETKAAIDQSTHRQPGVSGSAIIGNRTALIADVFELVQAVYPDWRTIREDTSVTMPAAAAKTAAEARGILLAEDSDFFRSQVKRYLEDEGFTVYAGADGEAAWQLLQEHLSAVHAVVTDIEMPRLNGLGLAVRIRADARTAHLPIIALTSLAGEEDIASGRQAGIDDYQVKLDRDRLISGLHALT